MQALSEKREQAASWYDHTAAASENSAIARVFPIFAERIRNGEADHRLDAIIAGQAA